MKCILYNIQYIIWKSLFAATPKMVTVLEMDIRYIRNSLDNWKILYIHTAIPHAWIFPPLIISQLMRMYLGNPVLCTALLTLAMLSFWRSSPAPPWLVCNTASVGQVHHCSARWLKHYSGIVLLKIFGLISKSCYLPLPLGVVANNAYPTKWVDQIPFLRHQNPTWNTWDKNFECGTAQPS